MDEVAAKVEALSSCRTLWIINTAVRKKTTSLTTALQNLELELIITKYPGFLTMADHCYQRLNDYLVLRPLPHLLFLTLHWMLEALVSQC